MSDFEKAVPEPEDHCAAIIKNALEDCPEMLRLRVELNKRCIDWWDDSHIIDLFDGCYMVHLRTKWIKDGHVASCIWGYVYYGRNREGATYGWPDLIECWYEPHDRAPQPMSVDEILEACT